MKFRLLLISIIGTIFPVVLMVTNVRHSLCSTEFGVTFCFRYLELIFNLSLFFPIILFFSLLTYRMSDSVFTAWWKFARYAIPIGFILLAIIFSGILHGSTAGSLGMGDFMNKVIDFYSAVLIYVLFILGSCVQIYRGRKKVDLSRV